MKTNFDCIPCFLRQTLDTARTLELDDRTTDVLLRRTLALVKKLDWNLPPPLIGRDIHRTIREILENADPYAQRKISDTHAALMLLPEIEAKIAASKDSFLAAVKFSIAGNGIDLGAKSGSNIDVHQIVESALTRPVDKNAALRLQEALSNAKSVLFLADNAGEIVFDRPLLEKIGSEKVTVAVRGAPVINDATLDDAKRSLLTDRFRFVTNGTDTPGTCLDECSREFIHLFQSADVVIAKGQGNYESLCDSTRPIFFLFMVKCALVSREVGVPINTHVVQEKNPKQVAKRRTEDTAILGETKIWFDQYMERFLCGNESFRHNIGIKLDHTRRVCREIVDLATSLGLSSEQIAFSELLALLHDIGRFEQYERYGTFVDRKSEDHAELGIRILEKNRVLSRWETRRRALIERCVANHNRLRIPDGENEECLFYSRLLRDADKLDIWRVVTEYYLDSGRRRNSVMELDTTESTEISTEVANAVWDGRLSDSKHVRTSTDYKVLQMSWIFDINFPPTFQLVDERKYLEKIRDVLPSNEMTAELYRRVRCFLDARLEG